jgi:hypothetical protein
MQAQPARDETVSESREENVPLEALARGTVREPEKDDISTYLESTTLASDGLLLSADNTLADSSAAAMALAAATAADNNSTSANHTTVFLEELMPGTRHVGPMAICCFINHILCERFGGKLVCFSFMLKFISPTVICALVAIVNIAILLLAIYQLCYRKI